MSKWFARLWPVALFAVAAGLMYRSSVADPFDPALAGTARYGHNHAGALQQMLLVGVAELAVFYAVLLPGGASVGRAAVALLIFLPWALFMLVMLMHAGGVVAAHWLFLAALVVGALVTLIARALARRR